MRIKLEGVNMLYIVLAASFIWALVFEIAYETAPTTPPVEVTMRERTNVLLATCFPAPAYTYKNATPLCSAFKQYVIEQADKFDSTANQGAKP